MKTNQPVLTGLSAQLETIRMAFYKNAEFAEAADQETFENAINEAQTAIAFVIASNLVAQARNAAEQEAAIPGSNLAITNKFLPL